MELIKTGGSGYETYERLLLERDQLQKEAAQIWTVYLQMFGELITDNYEEKLECIKCKKTISYCQQALNRKEAIDPDALRQYLNREMAEYFRS